MPLSSEERREINALVARFETSTHIEAVAAVVHKADGHPDIPWKAYALGSALAALAIAFAPGSVAPPAAPVGVAQAMAVVGAGAVFAAAALWIAPFGRLFLDPVRARAEARQHALALFVRREIFRTPERRAALLLVCRFERTAIVLPDAGLPLDAGTLERIESEMTRALRRGGPVDALRTGLSSLAAFGPAAPPGVGRTNRLADGVIVEKGT